MFLSFRVISRFATLLVGEGRVNGSEVELESIGEEESAATEDAEDACSEAKGADLEGVDGSPVEEAVKEAEASVHHEQSREGNALAGSIVRPVKDNVEEECGPENDQCERDCLKIVVLGLSETLELSGDGGCAFHDLVLLVARGVGGGGETIFRRTVGRIGSEDQSNEILEEENGGAEGEHLGTAVSVILVGLHLFNRRLW